MENQVAEKNKSVLLHNLTGGKDYLANGGKKKVIIISSLRNKTDEPEITLAPGQIVDLTIYGSEKVKNNAEVKFFQKMNCIKILEEYPSMNPEEKSKAIESHKKDQQANKIADIQGSSSVTELEDFSNDDSLPMEVRFAAMKRLQAIEGDMEEAPELKDNPGQNNIITSQQ